MTVSDEHEHPAESRHQQKGSLHKTTERKNEDSAAGVCKCLWFLDPFVSFWQQRHKVGGLLGWHCNDPLHLGSLD